MNQIDILYKFIHSKILIWITMFDYKGNDRRKKAATKSNVPAFHKNSTY